MESKKKLFAAVCFGVRRDLIFSFFSAFATSSPIGLFPLSSQIIISVFSFEM